MPARFLAFLRSARALCPSFFSPSSNDRQNLVLLSIVKKRYILLPTILIHISSACHLSPTSALRPSRYGTHILTNF